MIINPLLAVDGYKLSHREQYPAGTTMVYSNLTPRSDKLCPIPKGLWTGEVTFFGLQYFIKDFLKIEWDAGFFLRPKDVVIDEYERRIAAYLGPDAVSTEHIEALHALGYLPICIKALPEGTNVPIKTPLLTIYNTHPDFAWLTNYLETALSAYLWKPTTSATIARHYRLLLDRYADLTGADKSFVPFQGHDFAMRGLSGIQDAALTGAGHLTSFVGTDTIPAIDLVETYYNVDATQVVVGNSVPATEHSVSCSNILSIASNDQRDWSTDDKMADAEKSFIRHLITNVYPTGIVSIVADSFDFWQVVSELLPELKTTILNRQGKTVCRPDSGNPVEIICGKIFPNYDSFDSAVKAESQIVHEEAQRDYESDSEFEGGTYYRKVLIDNSAYYLEFNAIVSKGLWQGVKSYVINVEYAQGTVYFRTPEDRGAVETLWDAFGGTINEKGYKVLNEKVGLIYGDSITLERAEAILKGLEAKGFCSSNIVLGVGSFSYQYVTRDSFGFAVKSTAAEIDGELVEIYKDPKTDNGTKKSARGFLSVQIENGRLVLRDRQPAIDMPGCQLREVFKDGELLIDEDFTTIRNRVLEQGGQG